MPPPTLFSPSHLTALSARLLLALDNLVSAIDKAAVRQDGIVAHSLLQPCARLSAHYGANVLLKREDLQEVRSFKIRGAYNLISSLPADSLAHGVACASAGNHAQGVAWACAHLGIKATIFMPEATPNQKVERVRHFGNSSVTVILQGDSYDDAQQAALEHCASTGATLVHPFDDLRTIIGQGTIGKEIYDDLGGEHADSLTEPFAFLVAPVGGGGLISGIASYLKPMMPALQVVGAEPQGSPSMHASLRAGHVVTLDHIDTFIDGAAVKRVGDLTFEICSSLLDSVQVIPEGAVCTAMIDLYQNEGIIAEPAGALSVAALDSIKDKISGKTVVCILSGGNNDILRYPEIMERSLIHQGRKHYFLISFAQKPGQLRAFVDSALGPTDDIVRFEYLKKTNKERGAALVGIELASAADLLPLLTRMNQIGLDYSRLDSSEPLYDYLI